MAGCVGKVRIDRMGVIQKLPVGFFRRSSVTLIAKELLGKVLVTQFDGFCTAGVITETEAYEGVSDKASHAYGGRLTSRTEVMYREGGLAYVYLCYGIHSLFNIVTNRRDIPHAILIRGVFVIEGIQAVLSRLGKSSYHGGLTQGPGLVSKALGIHYKDTGEDLQGERIWLEDRGFETPEIKITPRIGIAYAGQDALLPYRFVCDYHGFTTRNP